LGQVIARKMASRKKDKQAGKTPLKNLRMELSAKKKGLKKESKDVIRFVCDDTEGAL
jgi:hypothetical protein